MSVSAYRGDDSLRLSRRAAVPEQASERVSERERERNGVTDQRCKENGVLVREVERRSSLRCQSRVNRIQNYYGLL